MGNAGCCMSSCRTKVEKDIGERITEYALRLWRRDHLPVESVVVFLRPVVSIPEPRLVIARPWVEIA